MKVDDVQVGVYGRCRHQEPPTMDQTEEAQSSGLPHNPIVLAVPCSSAPGPCKCPEREKVARHRDRQQTAARRSPVDTVVENPAAQLSRTSPSPTTPSPSHVQPLGTFPALFFLFPGCLTNPILQPAGHL